MPGKSEKYFGCLFTFSLFPKKKNLRFVFTAFYEREKTFLKRLVLIDLGDATGVDRNGCTRVDKMENQEK